MDWCVMKKKRLVQINNNPYHAFYGYGWYPYWWGTHDTEHDVADTYNETITNDNFAYDGGAFDGGGCDGGGE